MSWFGYLLVFYWLANAVTAVLMVDRSLTYKREAVVGQVLMYAALTWGAVTVGTHT